MYIGKKEAIALQKKLIDDFGGEYGIFDLVKLEACLLEPHNYYFGQEQYSTMQEKAAVYLYKGVTLHPFFDGNKRAGFLYALYFLENNKYELSVSNEIATEFVFDIAKGNKEFIEVVTWISNYTKGKSIANIHTEEILESTRKPDWSIYTKITLRYKETFEELAT